MIYPHDCPKCQKEFEIIKSVKDFDRDEFCPDCGSLGIKTIARRQSFIGAADWDTRHYNPALGMVVRSNKEAQKIARERGLVEIGNENVDKIHRTFDTEREKKISTRYDDIIDTSIKVSNG